jgi:hypothetical protein
MPRYAVEFLKGLVQSCMPSLDSPAAVRGEARPVSLLHRREGRDEGQEHDEQRDRHGAVHPVDHVGPPHKRDGTEGEGKDEVGGKKGPGGVPRCEPHSVAEDGAALADVGDE